MTPKRQGYIAIENMQPRIDEDGRKRCLNCDGLIPPGNRKYCSKECSRDFYTKHNWAPLRLKMIRQSNFTSAGCGLHFIKEDPSQIPRHLVGIVSRNRYVALTKDGVLRKEIEPARHPAEHFVVDHIVPIYAGGPEFEESNLQVLCQDCDKKKTAQDLRDYWKQRRGEEAEEMLKQMARLTDWIDQSKDSIVLGELKA